MNVFLLPSDHQDRINYERFREPYPDELEAARLRLAALNCTHCDNGGIVPVTETYWVTCPMCYGGRS